ncbi:MAG: CsbD family protein [Actinomycetaceae bacterium]|nr:CsbD family protein [Actinomycetaceae bacterium]
MALDETIKNKAEELTGKAKEAAGKVTGDKNLQAEGNVDQASGKAKEVGNKVTDKLDDAKEAVSDVAGKLGAHVKAAADKVKDAISGE